MLFKSKSDLLLPKNPTAIKLWGVVQASLNLLTPNQHQTDLKGEVVSQHNGMGIALLILDQRYEHTVLKVAFHAVVASKINLYHLAFVVLYCFHVFLLEEYCNPIQTIGLYFESGSIFHTEFTKLRIIS